MQKYVVKIDRKALSFLKGLSAKPKRRIKSRIDALAENPYPPDAAPIAGQKDIWRMRSGSYRIAYTVRKAELLILIVHIDDRKDFYKYFRRVKFR